MREGGGIRGLAAALALLGSGCDYLDNLFRPKEPDKVDLVLSVKDAWTGGPLPWAACSVEGHGEAIADAEGRITFPALPTGPKSVACSSESYYSRRKILGAGPGRGRFDLALARRGGSEWYPADPDRQVRIDRVGGNLRFPGKLVVQGFPADLAPIFKYAWTSTRHGPLPPLRPLPVVTGLSDQDSIEFTLTLTVTVTLAETTYVAGKIENTYFLSRNQAPEFNLKAYNLGGPERVGTGCETKYLQVAFSASDPDGDSCQVRLHSAVASPLGRLDTSMACGIHLVTLPLQPHDGLPDVSVTREGLLQVEVTDENQGTYDTSFNVGTYSNLHPWITFEPLDVREKIRAHDTLRFHLVARDRDAAMKSLVVDWKDGNRERPSSTLLANRDSLDDTLSHSFTKAGTYEVEAVVTDGCGISARRILPIDVEENASPPGTLGAKVNGIPGDP